MFIYKILPYDPVSWYCSLMMNFKKTLIMWENRDLKKKYVGPKYFMREEEETEE